MDAHTLVQAAMATITALLASLAVTGFMVGHARRRGMLDLPGQRRSHHAPTPRGGGLGLVAGVLAGGVLVMAGRVRPVGLLWVMLGTMLLVAAIGWIDDHRDLSIRPRIVVHGLAATAFCTGLVLAAGWSWWWLPPLVIAAMWSVNLHNFMDGTDGLLGLQLVFIGLLSAALCIVSGLPVLATANLVISAAATGFLVFNLPVAQIFMGDVGSGFAGLLVFMLGTLWCADDIRAVWPLLIMHAAFTTDASLTLLSRMLRGRRWYTAHREHMYQWLVRSGSTHGQIGCLYLTFNLLVLAPAAWLAFRDPVLAPWLCVAVYLICALLWAVVKNRCLARIRHGGARANA